MKALSAGLTFVNFATVCGLLLGIMCRGLGTSTAVVSLTFGAVLAFVAYLKTVDPYRGRDVLESESAQPARSNFAQRYKWLWLCGLAACFTMFAVRSFCWLLYNDSNELKIQSPNNLGDLALHITYIRNFASGVALWPDNPIYVFSKLRYPAGTDLFNALLALVHVDLIQGLVWVGLLASMATFYAFWRWAGEFGIAGFLFNGGTIGFEFLSTFQFQDYQGDKTIAWKSIPLAMFVTQRGLLYAIPAGLLLLWHWREKFFRNNARERRAGPLPFWVELSLYASMPLFHVHTFLALSVVLFFLFAFECLDGSRFIVELIREKGTAGIQSIFSDKTKWRDFLGEIYERKHIAMLLGAAVVPATFFVWLITDHFRAGSVLEWYPGWVLHDKDNNDFARPFFEFWFVNFGIWIPLFLVLLGLVGWRIWKRGIPQKAPEEVVFLSAATAIFLFGLLVKTAPWEWDNLKIMIWAYFLALPLLWTHLIEQWSMPVRVALCIALFGSGFVSLFGGLAADRTGYGFANRGEIDGVWVATRTLPVKARFAGFPVYNHPLLLQGRKMVLGYPGHLWTQGFDYASVYETLGKLMNGDKDWRKLARSLRVRYIFWGREEKINYATSTRPWEQSAPEIASGTWGAIYDLEPLEPSAPRSLGANSGAKP